MNIQMKATERYFLVVLFIVLYKVALTCRGGEGGEAAGREPGRKGGEKCTGGGTERGCGKLNSHGGCN